MKQGLQIKKNACKYVLAQIDDFGSLADTPSSKVEKSIKHIWMTIVEPDSERAADNNGFSASDMNINYHKTHEDGKHICD